MVIACISDIHSNLEALTKALETIKARGAEAVYCLGDVVGYGADPAACVDLIREHCGGVVMGNHDLAVATGVGLEMLPPDGREAALHNRAQLSEEQLGYLAGLPLRLEAYGCTFVHATPQRPEAWLRATSFSVVQEQFRYFETDVCFGGHTHVPGVVANKIGVFNVRAGNRYFINVGSVGQPRDNDSRLCIGFHDTESFGYELVREPYDVHRAAARIRAAGLPSGLASRLMAGT